MQNELHQQRFTILDGMILIAAIAAAIQWWKTTLWLSWMSASPVSPDAPLTVGFWPRGLYEWISVGTLAGLSLVWALLLMNLWRWRAAGWRLRLAPGVVGGLAIVVASLFHWGPYGIQAACSTPFSQLGLVLADTIVRRAEPWPGVAAIGVAWLVLRLGVGWRPEPTWLDRSGRILSLLWIVGGVISRWLELSL
jgi:hypothetical protein